MLEHGKNNYGTDHSKKVQFNIAADTKSSLTGRTAQMVTDGVSNTWHQGADELHKRTFEILERRYERAQGHPLTMQDYLAVVLLLGNVLQGAVSSNTWTNPVLKVIVGGSLAILAKLNDSVNNSVKQKMLKKLQDNFVMTIEEVPYGVDHILAKKCPSGYGTIISRSELIEAKGDPDNSLFATWQNSSCMQFHMHDYEQTKFTLHNLSNTADHYTKLSSTFILISWLVLFVNLGFDLSKIIIPTSTVSYGVGYDPNNEFTTYITADFKNPLQLPLFGNYSVTCNGYANGNYTAEMSVQSTIHTDPAVSTADWAMTALAGVPWMSLASIFISWMIKNEYNIREQAIRHAVIYRETYAKQVEHNLTPGYIPEDLITIEPNVPDSLLKILKTNKQEPDLYNQTGVLQYQINLHNQKMTNLRAFREGSTGQEFDSSSRGSGDNVACLSEQHFMRPHATSSDEEAARPKVGM